ncbi:hypothetical protein PUW81_004555 [Microbacterium sp. NM3R9]|uniref:hypothetical protein n=1 Tax=Microbacterium thalli TaxID=3027921 RepID=UPI002365617E|nr:hypothetical protein [Microbacterium thalli]MDN8548372.1 hypothetical protein [Microbacterium thalli]
MTSRPGNPARLSPHDPAWAETAQSRLDDVGRALAGLPGADRAHFDHTRAKTRFFDDLGA